MIVLAAEGELDPLLPHTVEIIVGLIAFALLVWLLVRAGKPTLDKSYAAATEKISSGLKRAEQAEAEAEAEKKRAQERLDGVRAETARIRDDARADGQQIKVELRAEAEEEAARIRAQAEQQVVAQREAAQRSLRGEIGGLSAELAERILAAELADPARRAATVDGFLSELAGMGPAAQQGGVR
ncbi:F0F1 ATP synthase subunit B [Pseudonocardia xishanensis]|uniref:ATP synthase subunit b n=1 Tax=Pseudonocardia xishanensis TaxID=630995 RepID=A0ABP8RJ74_9PSEU